jgi:hypothetical protein
MPGASCTIGVHFAPTATGMRAGTLTVSATPGGMVSAMLTGTGQAPAVFAIAPSPYDFGALLVGNSSSAVSFFAVNGGGVPSGVPVVNVGGADAADFAIMSNGCVAAVNPGASCMVSIVFTPSARGARSATLIVSATPGGSAMASLGGKGQVPSSLSITPTGQDFPGVVLGGSSSATFTVKNDGDLDSGIPAASLTGNPREFTVTGNTCKIALIGGDTCQVTINFTPMGQGPRPGAQLTVMATPGGTPVASLTGSGATALTLSPSPFAFGNCPPATVGPPKRQDFTVTNMGPAQVGAPAFTLTGANPTFFGIVAPGAGIPCTQIPALASGGTCTVGIACPGTLGNIYSATLNASAAGGGSVADQLTAGP